MSNLLTTENVAEMLGVSPRAVYQMVYRGKLPYVKLGNYRSSRLRFRAEEIEAYIDKCSRGAYLDKEACNV